MADHEQPPNTPHGQGPIGGAYPDATPLDALSETLTRLRSRPLPWRFGYAADPAYPQSLEAAVWHGRDFSPFYSVLYGMAGEGWRAELNRAEDRLVLVDGVSLVEALTAAERDAATRYGAAEA